MLKLLLLFGHLLGTSVALGAIVATDLRLLGKLASGSRHVAPPNRFLVRMIAAALGTLYATGACLVALGAQADPSYLANPKLQGKMALVLLLTVNAVVLHRITFPSLARGRPLARWKPRHYARVALPVGISNSLWLFCAFLGIARPWNYTVSIGFVLATAVCLAAAAVVVTAAVLALASHRRPSGSARLPNRWAAALKLGRPGAQIQ